ncbi:MAG: TonB-dependent receptor, partial [Candidatus Aminicenantes bacterium]|nr:TonB-dependent receptor [Candidatus Aminicenantes bacterium]
MKKHSFRLLAPILCLIFLGAQAFAQSANATLEGIITDNTNEPLPGANIVLKNINTGYTYAAVSKNNGSYTISGIIPGKYEIEVSLGGFKSQVIKDVVFTVGAKLKIDFVLVPSTISAEITVTAEAPLIEITKSEVSSVIDREKIDTLPLISRNFNDLTIISAGVIDGKSNAQPSGSGEMVVDGVSNEDITSNSMGITLPADAIQEFRVITNLAPAEFGNASGMITTAITRSGTNTFQGRLSYFYRDESFDSPNYFVNHAEYQGEELPKDQWQKAPFSRHNYGGFLGGPIIKDKLHFFILYDGLSEKNYSVITSPLVPRETVSQPMYGHQILAKFNYQMNEKNQFSARVNYYFQKAENQGVGGLYTKERAYNSKITDLSAVISWTSFFSSKTINEFRLLYSRGRNYSDPLYPDSYSVERPSGYFGKDHSQPQYSYNDKFEAVENFSLFLGDHSIKMGFDFIYAPSGTTRMDLYYPGVFTFATDAPFDPNNFGTYPIIFAYNRAGSISIDMPYYMFAVFSQDSWKVTKRLTLNYGLRWNYYDLTGLNEKAGDIHNFNPRLGFSFDPKGNGKSSIRGGIGIYSANMNSNSAGPIVFWSDFDLYIKVYPNYPDPFSPNPFFPPNIQFPAEKGEYVSGDLVPPWSLQTMLGYQRQLTKNISVSADVIYTRGYN